MAGWLLAFLGGLLAVYSVFLEIPLTLARRRPSSAHAPPLSQPKLVQTGTYALCRHPGFWWLLLFLGGGVLLANRVGMVQLALLWMALQLAVVAIQD
ncbi:MAG: hypothetical protein ACRDIB_07220, partial [Ardenticatenaceae bacterium]